MGSVVQCRTGTGTGAAIIRFKVNEVKICLILTQRKENGRPTSKRKGYRFSI